MSSMQALHFVETGKFEWREIKAPKIDTAHCALVRPLAVTRCDLDYYIATGLVPMPGAFAMGHETFGVVEAVGDKVRDFQSGDRVLVPFQISCGICRPCIAGRSNACEEVPKYSAFGLKHSSGVEWGGALADSMYVPFADAMLVHEAQGLSTTAHAAIADNAADGYRTVARVADESVYVKSVLVVGGLATSVGLYAVQAAIALGADVLYLDDQISNRDRAQQLGAEVAPLPKDLPARRFPIVVDAAGTPAGLDLALRATQPCGHCTSVSNGASATAVVPTRPMYLDGITWEISRVHARPAAAALLELAQRTNLDPDQVLSHRVSFDDAGDAMTEPALKMAFVRD